MEGGWYGWDGGYGWGVGGMDPIVLPMVGAADPKIIFDAFRERFLCLLKIFLFLSILWLFHVVFT